ncbi:hypothetical protein KRX51_05865 [Corynebacterium sp. TAE3-ERU12]|uniref:hypothetical protein n=1 Tax=Corynebacterium sp. TAE3-ERU12 TaxID=2849491 RepID=UPI001C43B8D6|nr:hypothetical protein [Corynebacterium sp. TAE3-ERU12]MBV7295445.1 hypothetical protein [Corynebacterium sp. TAE3-ERU12]
MERPILEQVWNPTQHIALWLGAWATGHAGFDHCSEALASLGPTHQVDLVDAYVPEVVDLDAPLHTPEFLRLVRAVTADGPRGVTAEPPVRLVLAGPGDVPALPAQSAAAEATRQAGSAVVLADADPQWHHVVVPAAGDAGLVWQWFSLDQPLPPSAHLSPGEADLQLADATRAAAAQVQARHHGGAGSTVPNPRLRVGALTDHFDLVATPPAMPNRAGGLIARADNVAAVLAVAQSGPGGSEVDPELIPLWRTVRQARTTAVEYAVREWSAQAAEFA